MDMQDAFAYCPRCSQSLQKKQDMSHCLHCGLNFYMNPQPCVTVIVRNSEGKYLLVKRAVEPKKGWLDLPGGFVETNETFEQAARREVKEELGVEIGTLEYIESYYGTYEYQGIVYPTVAVDFASTLADGARPKPADDVADFQFFDFKDIPFDKLAFPSLATVLKELERRT